MVMEEYEELQQPELVMEFVRESTPPPKRQKLGDGIQPEVVFRDASLNNPGSPKTFSSSANTHPRHNKKFRCSRCGRFFKTINFLTIHESTPHEFFTTPSRRKKPHVPRKDMPRSQNIGNFKSN
ncbi:unnamed protein product [Orchesella dallaii]|uniref:C2H2-type domain-containing protein n=1 Tax=Orchesella dallaii TaxID=48710 RepID=A0ABP1R8L8_9HEXA